LDGGSEDRDFNIVLMRESGGFGKCVGFREFNSVFHWTELSAHWEFAECGTVLPKCTASASFLHAQ